jgi:hypothetical protein
MKQQELALRKEKDLADIQLRIKKMEQDKEVASMNTMAKIKATEMANQARAEDTNKNIALELKTNDKAY